MPKSRQVFKRRRLRLFKKQNGKCHWCGEQMQIIDYKGKTGNAPANALTVDHLYSRFDPRRKNGGVWVAACRSCNNKRAHEEEMALPIEERWRRAGHLERMQNQTSPNL